MKKSELRQLIKEEVQQVLLESTRARIGIEDPSGKIISTYIHNDGEPTGAGKILKSSYKNPAKIKQLLALGDISSLGRDIGSKHDFVNPPKGEVNAYGRDRGESNIKAKKSSSRGDYESLTYNTDGNYAYLYSMKDKKWHYFDRSKNNWKIL